jgi:hypothetical protein
MTCGLQVKNFAFYPTCDACISNAYPRMHAAFDQNCVLRGIIIYIYKKISASPLL